jgi:hypothetical protein
MLSVLVRRSDGKVHCPTMNSLHRWRIDGKRAYPLDTNAAQRNITTMQRTYYDDVLCNISTLHIAHYLSQDLEGRRAIIDSMLIAK